MKTLLDAAVTAQTLDRLSRLQLNARGMWGRMNAHQMICHLCDSFRIGLGEREVSPASSALQRTLVKTLALRAPLPWPKGIQTRPEADQEIGGTPPVNFANDMRDLVEIIRRFAGHHRERHFGAHPVFGAMSEWEWMRWGYLHTDHHLRQFGL